MPSNQSSSWTPERVERLKELFHQGESMSFIGRALGGVSRNAVIGKVNRLGLTRTHYKAARKVARIAKPKVARKPKARRGDGAETPAPANKGHKSGSENKGLTAAPTSGKQKPKPQRAQEAVESFNVAFADLAPHHCRFPTSDDAPNYTFCGHERAPGASYCAAHMATAYTGTPKRKRPSTDIHAFLDELNKRRRPTLRAV